MTHETNKKNQTFALFLVGYSVTLVRKLMQVNVPNQCGSFSLSDTLVLTPGAAEFLNVYHAFDKRVHAACYRASCLTFISMSCVSPPSDLLHGHVQRVHHASDWNDQV